MENLLQDIRFGLRSLAKNPGLTAVAVIALTLGIGANSVMFTSVEACLLRPFAFKDLDRAVFLWEAVSKQSEDHIGAAPANFLDWNEWNRQNKSFDLLAATRGWDVNLTGSGLAERVEGSLVTSDFFALLGIAPEFGRSIGPSDFATGHQSVVVLSHGFWQRHLGGDAQIVGRNLLMNGARFTVIGVMPADFDFPVGADAWSPLDLTGAPTTDRSNHYLNVIGRLRAGVSPARAQSDLAILSERLGRQFPATNAGHGVHVLNLVRDMTFGTTQFVLTLMGAAVFVLLLACANVMNLNLARATARQKEIAMRIALGAGRWRIARQLIVEGVLVSTLGAGGGLLLSSSGLDYTKRTVPPFIMQHVPGMKYLRMDSRVLLLTLAIAVAAGILAAAAPAFQASKTDLNDVLKEGGRSAGSGRSRNRLRALLVAFEVALALVLLVGAGLMVRGFRNLLNSDVGFDRTRVLTFHVALAESKYRDAAAVRGFYDQLISRLQALPGAQSAAAATSLPSSWSWDMTAYRGEGQPPAAPGELRTAVSQSISPDFFRTLRMPLIKGRFFTDRDGASAPPVAVISEKLAHRIWPDQDAVGKRIQLGGAKEPWRTVVGVSGDIRQSSFDSGPHATAYVPLDQSPRAESALLLRTVGDPAALASAARAAVVSLDPDQPAFDLRTLEQLISDNDSGVEFSAQFMSAFGVIALALAAAGIFAVMAYSVKQRTHEMGIRMALGAQGRDVLRLVVGYSGRLVLIGLAVGVPCAVALSRALESLLFGVVSLSVPLLVALTTFLALVAALAAYLPARWAAKVDPLVALRHE